MNSTRDIRRHNEARCLTLLYRSGSMSRADLARGLDLTRSTLSKLTSDLLQRGLLREAELVRTEGRTGRPGTLIELRGEGRRFLGIGLEPGEATFVIADLRGELRNRWVLPLPSKITPDEAGHVIADAISSRMGNATPKAVAISIPGIVNRSGVVLSAPKLQWEDVNLPTVFKNSLASSVQVFIANDANASAIAALQAGEVRPDETAIYALIGSGLGLGILQNGSVLEGAQGYAGEAGFLRLGSKPDAPVLQDAIHAAALLHQTSLSSFADLAKAASQPGREADSVAKWAETLGFGLANISMILNPARIVIGGEVSALASVAIDPVRTALRRAMRDKYPPPTVAFSELGADGPAFGAALMLHNSFIADPSD